MAPEHVDLIKGALAGKLRAVGEYDAIIWKIRAGYAAILYGGMAVLLGKEGSALSENLNRELLALAIFLLIVGFSFSIFLVDFAFVKQKLKVVVSRDALLTWFLNEESDSDIFAIAHLLNLSGEDPRFDSENMNVGPSPAGHYQYDVGAQYKLRMNWHLRRVLLPLYCTAPVIALLLGIALAVS